MKRSALLLHPASDIYELVRDVSRYPEFLSWCTRSRVLSESASEQLASLEISLGGLRQTFTTRNHLVPDSSISLELENGPFKQLTGAWKFEPLSETGSRVNLQLQFEFASSLLSAAFQRGFAHVADRLVYDFGSRADEIYGKNS